MLEALKGGDAVVAIYPKTLTACLPACLLACFFILSSATMSLQPENGDLAEKHAKNEPPTLGEGPFGSDPEDLNGGKVNLLHQDLKGRHMQMIAMQVSAR